MNYNTSNAPAISYRNRQIEASFVNHCIFEIKKPANCSIAELHQFYILLKKGNKVSLTNLHEKILSAKYLGFCYHNKKLIGISAIKKPTKAYIQAIHEKAGIIRNIHNNFLEIGYSFTREEFREKGISSNLKRMLFEKIHLYKGILFSTTATPSSQRFLKANGFNSCGNVYQGIFDDSIAYFERSYK
ncbi:hypothetical protein ACFOWA_14345 [Pedobacter lithocola]|uniref:N-acetyltransferase domain-containing protein n=1 Tax=Pedobacter lithocola TaxID=1908239 RepID=A0ABV8PE71_9SPHI